MLSDLHPLNVIYSRSDDRLVYVDYESLRPGNNIFDVVFFLSLRMAIRSPREVTDRLAFHVFSASYRRCPAAKLFFRDFASYIVATYMTIGRHDRESIEANLDALRTPAPESASSKVRPTCPLHWPGARPIPSRRH
jgi:hypothetical protein